MMRSDHVFVDDWDDWSSLRKKDNQPVLFAQIGFFDRMDKFPTKKEIMYVNIMTTPKSQPDNFIPSCSDFGDCLFVHLSNFLSAFRLSAYLDRCLSACLSVCLFVCPSLSSFAESMG